MQVTSEKIGTTTTWWLIFTTPFWSISSSNWESFPPFSGEQTSEWNRPTRYGWVCSDLFCGTIRKKNHLNQRIQQSLESSGVILSTQGFLGLNKSKPSKAPPQGPAWGVLKKGLPNRTAFCWGGWWFTTKRGCCILAWNWPKKWGKLI